MEKHIIDLVELAARLEKNHFEEYWNTIDLIKSMLHTLAVTSNCPDNWRAIGSNLVSKYNGTKLYEDLELVEYDV